eukprot:scaffold4527_cov133-Isochrysis_galbana.AAC.2
MVWSWFITVFLASSSSKEASVAHGTCTCVRETCHGNGWKEREDGNAVSCSPQLMGMLVCLNCSAVCVDHAGCSAFQVASRRQRGVWKITGRPRDPSSVRSSSGPCPGSGGSGSDAGAALPVSQAQT